VSRRNIDIDDGRLLQQFEKTRAREDFAPLVERHAALVYSACLRQLADRVEADRATQAVFILLAQQARRLKQTASLVPWFFERAHEVCKALPRGGQTDAAPTQRSSADWSRLSDRFDAAVVSLPAQARLAFLLKYVAACSLRDVADALNVSDNQAGRQISQGVADLRRFYDSQGVSVAPETLVASLQAHAVHAAPQSVVERAILAPFDPAAPAAALSTIVTRARRRRELLARASLACTLLFLVLGIAALSLAIVKRHRAAKIASLPTTQTAASPASAPPSSTSPPSKPVKPVSLELAARTIAAIRYSDTAALQQLVEQDENVINARDPDTGRSAIEIAADLVSWDHPDATRIAHFLIHAGALTDIHTAARAGDAACVTQLLQANPALLEARDAQGLTPLQRAALIPGSSPECEAVVDLLIGAGAKVDLWTACTFARVDDVQQALAAHPEQINQPCLGATPLNWAVRPRRYPADPLAIPKLLLEHGADPRTRDTANDGMTPLHHAAAWGAQAPVAALLIQKGVDVNILDDFARTPLDIAIERRRKEMIAFFTSKGGHRTTVDYPNQPMKTARFFAAVEANDTDLTHRLLDDTPELAKTRGPTGETPLHHAAANGSIPIIDLLLADHADINAQETNKFGGTPLHWAVEHDHLEAVKHLLEKGANPRTLNQRNPQTLLHTVAQHTNDAPLTDLLLQQGIDPTAKDRRRNTAQDYATPTHPAVAARLNAK
jgi:RNA polymerase sigma factor (sigma-70 family)